MKDLQAPALAWRPLHCHGTSPREPLSPCGGVAYGDYGLHVDIDSPQPLRDVMECWVPLSSPDEHDQDEPFRRLLVHPPPARKRATSGEEVAQKSSNNKRLSEVNDWHAVHGRDSVRCPMLKHLSVVWHASVPSFDVATRSFDADFAHAIAVVWSAAAAEQALAAANAAAAAALAAACEASNAQNASCASLPNVWLGDRSGRSSSGSGSSGSGSGGSGAANGGAGLSTSKRAASVIGNVSGTTSAASTVPNSTNSSFSVAPPTANLTPSVKSSGATSLAWAITEIRVVRGPFTEHAEYLLVASLGVHLVARWRRFNDFKALAAHAQARRMHKASVSWDRILHVQRSSLFRDVKPDFLYFRAGLLKEFVRNYLFESRTTQDVLLLLGGDSVLYL